MGFEDSIREAAKRADQAVNLTMEKYSQGRVTDEDDITGVLVGRLDEKLEGQIGGLVWSTSVVRHRRGVASEESMIGADIVIHVSFQTRVRKYAKGVLVQAKRVEPGHRLNNGALLDLVDQCNKMLQITPASFVFAYAKGGMRCGAASRIAGSSSRNLHEECIWTSYRFFLELFRCPIGDPSLTSSSVRELPVPTKVVIEVSGDEIERLV
jgi:hypothetical protein